MKWIVPPAVLFVLTLSLTLSANQNPAAAAVSSPAVTVPNGSSPAKANAPRAPMNDSESARSAWNHGNGVLWVLLNENPMVIGEAAQEDSGSNIKGYSRRKFGWWRGVSGKFIIEGRRLDAPAPPIRYRIQEDAYGAFGFIPSALYFPSEGYWELTGRLNDQSLTFVVHVVKGGPAT